MKVKSESEVAQSCSTLHNPMDYQRQWVAIAFSELKYITNQKQVQRYREQISGYQLGEGREDGQERFILG